MNSSPSGKRVVRKRLADGTIKTYTYTRERSKKRCAHPESLAAMLVAYRRSPEWASKSKATIGLYRIYLRHAEDAWGHLSVQSIRRREVMKLRDAVALMCGPGASSSMVKIISTMFTWGIDRGWLDHNPAFRIKTPETGHWSAWTIYEAEQAMERLPEPFRRVILLAMYTAQRRADLCAMTWNAYDGNTIRVTQKKRTRGKPPTVLLIPVHGRLKGELDQWKQTASSTHILTSQHGRPWLPTTLTAELPRAMAVAGLPAGLNVHGLRKLAATMLAEAGCSTHEIASITGHRTLGMVQLYTASADQEKLASAAIVRLQTARDNRSKLAG